MKSFIFVLMCMVALCGQAQKSYPKEVLTPVEGEITKVKFKGAAPGICDFITTLNNKEEGMFMDSGNLIDSWNHYLNNEQQEPGVEIIVDKKNGYVCQTFYTSYEVKGETFEGKSTSEMCYWNCADGKHKLFALSNSSMTNGHYSEGQCDGLLFYLYDNAKHIIWYVPNYQFGVDVDPGTDEHYEYDAQTQLAHVKDRETGEPLTLNREEFYRWIDERPAVVYRLPRKGKNIIAEIHYANRTDTVELVWDGMHFNRK
ncbi:MAG: hypothetical protein IKW85_10085 [Muribaculaceae bacterium]|nr:hypothetical protein [Muribaculaceae bacterium]